MTAAVEEFPFNLASPQSLGRPRPNLVLFIVGSDFASTFDFIFGASIFMST